MLKKKFTALLIVILVISIGISSFAVGITYLPDVTADMSDPFYWTNETDVLMSIDQIESLNALTISTNGTCMYDLKNQSETVDGVALNQAVLSSSRSNADYYAGWTYIESSTVASKADYNEMVYNTQNPNASRNQKVLYGIAVKRTELRTFPSPKAIWDDPSDIDLDYQYLTAVRVNEPLVITSVSADGKYYLAKSICCSGWVPSENVAICSDKNQWLSAWDIAPQNALVVYGDKVYLDNSITGPQTSALLLTMGTVLKKADIYDPDVLIDNRAAYQNFVAWVPVRNSDGSYSEKLTLISEHNKVSDGYLPLTKKNISKVAFSALGNTYGWGGSLLSDDCSGYIRSIYKCFGLELARNTTWQTSMPMGKIEMKNMCREERMDVLDKLPFGAILYFNGHEMMYLGSENGKYYVISAVGSIMQPKNSSVRQRIRSTVINTLEIKRGNGNTWLDELTYAIVPYLSEGSESMPKFNWYHYGVAYCLNNNLMKGDTNKCFNPDSNITWAEVCQIMWNMAGNPKPKGGKVSDGMWYDNAVKWANEAKIIDGNILNFNPETAITREQLASVFYLYARHKGYDTKKSKNTDIQAYTDAYDISEYAVPAVRYVIGKDIMKGKTDTTIDPKANTTRAEVATIVERFVLYK